MIFDRKRWLQCVCLGVMLAGIPSVMARDFEREFQDMRQEQVAIQTEYKALKKERKTLDCKRHAATKNATCEDWELRMQMNRQKQFMWNNIMRQLKSLKRRGANWSTDPPASAPEN